MNILRKKIECKEKIMGTLVSLTDPCLCEIVGNIGFDCVWIDMEHTYISFKEALCHLNASRSADIPAIVRLPQNDLTSTKKVLEMGPEGIIFPNDLSGSLGEMLNVFGDKTLSKIKYATELLKKHGKFVGLAGGMSESDIKIWSELDINMLFAGADWCFVYEKGKETLNNLKNIFDKQ